MPDFFDVVRSQRGGRYYKPDDISQADIEKILQATVRAPSGSNRQGWRFIVVRDRNVKRQLNDVYLEAQRRSRGLDSPPTPPPGEPLSFAFDMENVPVLMVVCMEKQTSGQRDNLHGASIYPAVQNLLLAAAALGINSRLTTIWHFADAEFAEVLGIPDEYEAMAMMPMGYPRDPDHLGGSIRKPISEVTFYDKWGQGQ